MSQRLDRTGQRFGHVTVLEFAGRNKRNSLWLVRCDCGERTWAVTTGHLLSGNTRTCGRSACPHNRRVEHGHAFVGKVSQEYRAWRSMKHQCLNPKATDYANYGARGISIYPQWVDSFEAFLAYVGPKPSAKSSLQRIDTDGNYEPGNVRWAPVKVQAYAGRRGYYITKQDEERFWKKVDRTTTPDGCWPWLAALDENGYGRFRIGGGTRLAHHVALEMAGFIIPAEFLQARHLCHNRPCVRVHVDHLKIGTSQENADDMVSAGRQARGEAIAWARRGERNHGAKLQNGYVTADEIRHLYAAGGTTHEALGQQFGVARTTIGHIIRGDTWCRPTDPEPEQ